MKNLILLFILLTTFINSCCNLKDKKMKLEAKIGYVGDSANFYKQVLYLEDLNLFSEKLYNIHRQSDKNKLILFYKETMSLLSDYNQTSYISEIHEKCEDLILDVGSHQEYEFADLFSTWSDFKLFYSSAININSIEQNSEYETLSQKEYSELIVYSSKIIEEAEKDEEYDFIFGYTVLGKENGKTKIALYELEFD